MLDSRAKAAEAAAEACVTKELAEIHGKEAEYIRNKIAELKAKHKRNNGEQR